MIFKNGKDFTVKLIDFGSCQRQGTALPHHAHTTMWYWSPEIWQALNHKVNFYYKYENKTKIITEKQSFGLKKNCQTF